jgi:hypothetical protein
VTLNIFDRKCSSDFPVVSMEMRRPTRGSSSTFMGPKPCLPFAPASVKRRERKWLLKSHCASWILEIACHQSRMWL